ncbi:MAG: sigma-70 family RNA polymerase sigma factor [Planctomycetota bacterium]
MARRAANPPAPTSPGDPGWIEGVWHSHRRWVAAILLAHKPKSVDLEDLLQDVALAVVKHAENLRDPAALKGWLRTVAINTARTAGRRVTTRSTVIEGNAARPDDAPSVDAAHNEQQAAFEEGQRALRLARSMPPAYGEALILRAVRGMSYRHIADVLGVPITTVETRLTRARRMLREAMEAEVSQPVAGRIEPTSQQGGDES